MKKRMVISPERTFRDAAPICENAERLLRQAIDDRKRAESPGPGEASGSMRARSNGPRWAGKKSPEHTPGRTNALTPCCQAMVFAAGALMAGVSPAVASPVLYYSGAAGATAVQWASGYERSIVARGELRIGWQAADWVSLEASAFSTATARHDYGIWYSTAIGGLPGQPDPNHVWFVRTGSIRHRIDGFAAGPVFSLPVSSRLRLFTRQQVLHAAVHGSADAMRYYRPAWRSTEHETGYQAGLGLTWRLPRTEQWELAAEVTHSENPGTKMTSLLASVRWLSGRRIPDQREPADIYVTAGSGISWLNWRTGDHRSEVARQHVGLGWRISRWVALEMSYAHFGAASNFRVYWMPTYDYVWGTGTYTRGIPEPRPWVMRRRVEAAALGTIATLPVSPSLELFSRQQAARVTEYEWGKYLHIPRYGPVVTKFARRTWRYQPGVGVAWKVRADGRLRLAAEAVYFSTARVRTLSVIGTAAFVF